MIMRIDFLLGRLLLAAAVSVFALQASLGQPPAPQPAIGSAPMPAGVDVLTRGPLHEAFAEPVNLAGTVTPVIPKQPPQPIAENPAEMRPDSDDATWIPGYWSWDDQQNNYIWVSGVWRIPPPGRQWIGGYWTVASGGYQWVPGFWSSAETNDVQYYPPPPAALEQGPSGNPPSADDFWAPGTWDWQGNQFVWTNGFWTAARSGWVWTPTYYSFTPRGYARVDGYWDYDLARRGVVFAPLAISPAVYGTAGFSYMPSIAIDPNVLSFYLFARPSYCQYYFGDYFGAEYDRMGFYPWYAVGRGRAFAYDPLYSYDRWYYAARDPEWIGNLEHWHDYYRQHPDARPPHDLAAARQFATQHANRPDRDMLMIGRPVSEFARSTSQSYRLARLTAADAAKARSITQSHRAFEAQRAEMEAGRAGAVARAANGPQKATFPHRDHVIGGPRSVPNNMIGQGRAPSPGPAQPGPTPHQALKPIVPNEVPGTEPRPQARPEPRPEIRPEPRPEIRPEPRPEIRPEPRPETRPEPRPRPETRPEPRPLPQPRPEARPAPQPQPRPESRPAPQAQPRHPTAPNFQRPQPPHPAPHEEPKK
jgi:hypothetical protein